MNSARRNITERYILKCDEVFAITAIGRAATDAGVKSVVTLARRAGLSNIGIICTKSDVSFFGFCVRLGGENAAIPDTDFYQDIEAEEAMKDWRTGNEPIRIEALMDQVNACRDNLNQVQDELNDLDEEEDLSPEDLEIAQQLRRKQVAFA